MFMICFYFWYFNANHCFILLFFFFFYCRVEIDFCISCIIRWLFILLFPFSFFKSVWYMYVFYLFSLYFIFLSNNLFAVLSRSVLRSERNDKLETDVNIHKNMNYIFLLMFAFACVRWYGMQRVKKRLRIEWIRYCKD